MELKLLVQDVAGGVDDLNSTVRELRDTIDMAQTKARQSRRVSMVDLMPDSPSRSVISPARR